MEDSGKSVVPSSSKEEEDAEAKKPKMRLERKRKREEEMKVLSDLSVFQNVAAMLEAEKFRKKKKRRGKKKKKESVAMENAGKSVVSSSSKEEKDDKAKKPNMRLERKRTREEEMKVLSDLSVFQNLAAMLEAEKFRKKKRRRGRKKKKEDVAMENAGKSVVSSSSKEEKHAKAKKPKMRLERNRTREEEMKLLSDLSVFQNFAAMLEAESFRKKKKRKKRKKKENIEVGAQEDGAEEEQVDLAKDVESNNLLVSENIVPQKPLVDVERGQVQPETVKAVTTTKALETGSVSVSESITTEKLFASTFLIDEESTSQEAKKKCTKHEEVMSSLDEFKMLSDLSNFKNLAAMMEAESFMRSKKRKKRRKNKRNREFEAPLRINVDSVEEQKQVDAQKGADTLKSFQIESINMEDNVVLQKLLQAPRYFDPPESSWSMCQICGEGHTTVGCPAEKREKPCFLCGSFEHGGSHCKQEIQCYMCMRYGHLCCVDFPDMHQSRQLSCYKCSHLGHSGSDKLRMGGSFVKLVTREMEILDIPCLHIMI